MASKFDLAEVAEMDGSQVDHKESIDQIIIRHPRRKVYMDQPSTSPSHDEWKAVAKLVGMSIPELKKFTGEVARAGDENE